MNFSELYDIKNNKINLTKMQSSNKWILYFKLDKKQKWNTYQKLI